MLENQVAPLFVARRVLKERTLQEVGRAPYTLRGWAILDRWAMNSPAALQALEAQGGIEALKVRLLDQQDLESRAMLDYCELVDAGTPELEILALTGIATELLQV